MSAQYQYDMEEEEETDASAIRDALLARLIPGYGDDGDPPEPEPETTSHYRHPLAHFDFYFFFAAAACMMATTTSMIDQWMLEPLIFTSIALTWIGIVLNLTRDRTHVFVTHRHIHITLKWPFAQPLAAKIDWSKLQAAHGVTPIRQPKAQ